MSKLKNRGYFIRRCSSKVWTYWWFTRSEKKCISRGALWTNFFFLQSDINLFVCTLRVTFTTGKEKNCIDLFLVCYNDGSYGFECKRQRKLQQTVSEGKLSNFTLTGWWLCNRSVMKYQRKNHIIFVWKLFYGKIVVLGTKRLSNAANRTFSLGLSKSSQVNNRFCCLKLSFVAH